MPELVARAKEMRRVLQEELEELQRTASTRVPTDEELAFYADGDEEEESEAEAEVESAGQETKGNAMAEWDISHPHTL